MSSLPTLLYFDISGRAELTRLAFVAGGVQFIDKRIDFATHGAMKDDPTSLQSQRFGSLPIVQHGDFIVSQSSATAQYAAALGGLTENLSPKQKAVDAQFLGCYADLQAAMYKILFGADDAAKAAGKKECDAIVARFLPVLERLIPAEGFINGRAKPTLADLAVFDVVTSKAPGLLALGYTAEAYPKIVGLVARVGALPKIAAYKNGLPKYKLSYFNGRGLAEVSRMLFSLVGQEFEDKRYPIEIKGPGDVVYPEFLADKEKFPMGQLPVLEVQCDHGSVSIPQSKAVERFIAKTFGLIPECPGAAAIQDAVGEATVDMRKKFWEANDDDKKKAFFGEALPGMLAAIEKFIGKNGLVSSAGVGLAEVQLFGMLSYGFKTPFGDSTAAAQEAIDKFPKIKALLETTAAAPGIAKWIAGTAEREAAGQKF